MNIAEFVKSAGVTMTSVTWHTNPNMENADSMDNWRCLLKCGRSQMTVYFSKGVAHNGAKPDPGEVLDCLASDAAGIDNARSFEDWCGDYGYDTVSRKAEKIYKACQRQAQSLKRVLGDSAYETLLFKTERE